MNPQSYTLQISTNSSGDPNNAIQAAHEILSHLELVIAHYSTEGYINPHSDLPIQIDHRHYDGPEEDYAASLTIHNDDEPYFNGNHNKPKPAYWPRETVHQRDTGREYQITARAYHSLAKTWLYIIHDISENPESIAYTVIEEAMLISTDEMDAIVLKLREITDDNTIHWSHTEQRFKSLRNHGRKYSMADARHTIQMADNKEITPF